MTNEPAPLVPPMPKYRDDPAATGMDVDWRYTHNLEKWGRQCAEIAQAQARRADDANAWANLCNAQLERNTTELEAERDALKARVAEAESRANEYADMNHKQAQRFAACEATLAQRDREVLGLTEALGKVRDEIGGCLERDAKAFMGMTIEQVEAWNIARHNQSHGYVLDTINAALAATAQAGAEAEQRIREDEREHIKAIITEGWMTRDSWEAAILGTGGEDK